MKAIVAITIGLAGLSAMVAVAAFGQIDTTSGSKTEPVADASGNLHVPDAYRTIYQSLGTWAVGADQAPGAKELHVVYASRDHRRLSQ